ncbi:MAG TPA: DNA-formamidopyrimidine glycosylase family protein [Candidatus Polarisedimenticolia bacterium]|nr:DNA-formamidopyrimidine glycosylase family protein [Candidatus Polarisedimenticolia bacterium]
MPELPDITLYVDALNDRLLDRTLDQIRIVSPFLLRTVEPPVREAAGRRFIGFSRMGKCIVAALEGELFVVLHLMIAGRLQWKQAGAPIPGRLGLAAFDVAEGTLLLTEAGSRKRAWMRLVAGAADVAELDRGGLEVIGSTPASFRERLLRENHTLKRALTDPRLFSGIGNAYSDEILHAARLSPLRLTRRLRDEEIARLHEAAGRTLILWTERLRQDCAGSFPGKVTAFREGMAAHGRFRKPCPVCGTAIQRIVHAENECNYCPRCQTGGKLLADRSLSRLLKKDWPRTIEELEAGGSGKQ